MASTTGQAASKTSAGIAAGTSAMKANCSATETCEGEKQKRTPEQISRGMSANENDLKSGGHIDIKLNTQGYYVSLWRGNVLFYVTCET